MAHAPVIESLGTRIRKARTKKGWNAETLAYKIGATTQTIYRWERDEHVPTIGKLRVLAAVLDLPLSHFLEEGGAA